MLVIHIVIETIENVFLSDDVQKCSVLIMFNNINIMLNNIFDENGACYL